jgi:hypothetical protein
LWSSTNARYDEVTINSAAREEITMTDQHIPRIIMEIEEVTDPEELAQARARHERFARNADWLQRHATEIYTQYRGKCICVAGQELFIADTPEEVLAQPHSSPTAPSAVTDETAKTSIRPPNTAAPGW